MVFAKTSKAAERLTKQINNKEFKKTYYAVVEGMTDKEDTLEDYLYKDEKNNTSYVTDKNNGKLSILKYETIKSANNLSLVKIDLLTGRHHQIRVQFANIGHSLYGDQKYGVRGKGKQIRLWAYELEFEHPVKKEMMTFKSIPPFVNLEYVKL